MTQNKLKPSINLHNKKVPEKENCTVKRGCLNPVLKLVLIKRYYIQCPDGTFAIPPGNSLPNKLEEGLIVTPLKTDKVWKWIYPRYKKRA